MSLKKMFLGSLIAFVLLFVATTYIAPAPVYAADACHKNDSFFGLPTWYKYLNFDNSNPNVAKNCDLDTKNLVNDQTDIWLIVLAVLEMLMVLAGIIAVVFVIAGGFKYLTSMAEPEKIANAKNTIINALVGVVIAIIASQVVSFVANKIVTTTTDATTGLPKTASSSASLAAILQVVFVIMGAVSFLVVTLAGFNMIISRGDPQKVAKSRQTIIYAVVGLIVSILAASIVSVVINKVT